MARSFTSVDDAAFNRLFQGFRHTAYRLETLQHYDVSYERAAYSRFLNGEERGEFPGIAGWCDAVRAAVRAKKRMQRVHVVVEPLSEYVRFEFGWAYAHTVAAGEDVRVVPVSGDAWVQGLPRQDYWLFDSSELVTMTYADDGRFLSGEFVTDPVQIVRANYWRDLAVRESVPYREYIRQPQPAVP